MINIKTVRGKLPWSSKQEWIFPASDTRSCKSFTHGPVDLDTAIPMLLPHLKGRRTCIQAGGCLGIWPLRLSQLFERVITFEPEPTNYYCLKMNTAHLNNVETHNAALGQMPGGSVHMALTDIGNSGAHYALPGGDIPVVCIDDLGLDDVDLIYLDVEGYESQALRGATKTIKRCNPVIGVEDKRLHETHKSISGAQLLVDEFEYKSIGRPFTLDEIFIPC